MQFVESNYAISHQNNMLLKVYTFLPASEITEVLGILPMKLLITEFSLSTAEITEVSVFSFYRWL